MGTVSYQWSGPNSGSLTNSTNWTPTGVPGSGDIADFGQAGSSADITATGTDTVGEFDIHGDAVTLASGTIKAGGLYDARYNETVGTGIDDGGSLTLGSATTTATLNTDTLYVGSLSKGSLTVNAGSTLTDTYGYIGYIPPTDIDTMPDGVVTVTGSGARWTTYSLYIDGGSLVVENGGTVSVGTPVYVGLGGITLSDGTLRASHLDIGGSLNLDASSTLTGGIGLDGGTLNATGTGAITLANNIALEVTHPSGIDTINAGNTELTLTGAIGDYEGAGSVSIDGFVQLSHAGNSYSGGTFLAGNADLRVAADGAAGTGAITFTAGSGTLAVASGVTLSNAIDGFAQGDQIVLAGTTATSASWLQGVLTVDDGNMAVARLNLAGDYSETAFTVAGDGKGDSVITIGGPIYTNTFTLATSTDTITGTAGNDLIIAPPGTLNAGDTIDGGGGTNALELQGGGIFHVNAPTTLQNIQTLYASEGGTSSDQQNVFLRDGTNLAVEVRGSSDNPKAPWLNSITIHGADNSDTIYCGPGYDTVVLGSAGETVVGGSGEVGIVADIGMIGSATLSGGSGGGTLLITGIGGNTMGNNVTRIQTVILGDSSTLGSYQPMELTANALKGLTIIGTTTGDTIQAGGADQTLIGYNGANNNSGIPHLFGGFATLIGSTQGYDTFKDPLVDFGGDTIENFGAPGDVIDVTDVSPDGLSVSYGEGIPETNAQLMINGVAVTMIGTFTSSGFHTASDGHGGTDITYTAPTATTTTASKLTSAMASFSATSGGLDTSSPSTSDQHTPLLAASTGHA